MTGSFAKILRRCVDYLGDLETVAICPNFQSYMEAKKEPRFARIDYLYADFNAIFDRVDVNRFCQEYASINLSEVLMVDKTHFKKKSGDYQLRYVCAMGEQIAEIFKTARPDYVFIPIIETIDAMMAYRMAQHFGIRPIIYCHARFSSRSFFSESHCELLPPYTNFVEKTEADAAWAVEFLRNYRADPGPFNTHPDIPGGETYKDIGQESAGLFRLIRNIKLKSGIEKHNQMIKLWISFQVRFQTIFIPIRNALFYLIEKFYIKPRPAPASGYDFFPLHLSPESSINVPAPYYVDQLRVVDKILLDRPGNRTLVVKEHWAMYGIRPISFYRALKTRSFISFVPRATSSLELIKNAHTVYSVTGTACLEAFFLGVNWVQFGNNFLSDWIRSGGQSSEPKSPLNFIRDVLSVSRDCVLYSPGRSFHHDQVLFSKKNVEKLCDLLKFHIENCSRETPSAPC